MKVDVKNYKTAKDIENAQQIWTELENTQNSLWKRLKNEIAVQIDVKSALPVDNNIHELCYDAPNGKHLGICFNTSMAKFVVPKFHIGAVLFNVGQDAIEETFAITNICNLADDIFFTELVEKYAYWIKKKLDKNMI